jgi:DMSO/TMAO reductase YedYZ molybdopterin-dependent catalytic subunit
MNKKQNKKSLSRREFMRISAAGGFAALLSACGLGTPPSTTSLNITQANVTPTPTPVQLISKGPKNDISAASLHCQLPPVAVPTQPAVIPGYTQLDPSTGLHMTGTVQNIELSTYRLKVSGKVDQPLSLTYDELRCLPKLTARPTLICPGYFEDVATWSGASLKAILDMAGIQSAAKSITLVAAGGFESYIPLDEALREDNFLAYEWAGQPVPILHGFPVRAVFPSMEGNRWVKWLTGMRVE